MDTPEARGQMFVDLVRSPSPNRVVCDVMTEPLGDREFLSQRLKEIGLGVLSRLDQKMDEVAPSPTGTVIDIFSRRSIQ